MRLYTAAIYEHYHRDDDFGQIHIIGPERDRYTLAVKLLTKLAEMHKLSFADSDSVSDKISDIVFNDIGDVDDLRNYLKKHLFCDCVVEISVKEMDT
jgi:hypothetical protein